jgi:sugar/nucleoside kinase (ribokinase family)
VSLLVVGSVAFDKIETPFGKTDRILGGAGTYIGLAASLLTDDIKLVSVVGADFPESYLKIFTDRHIDIDGLKVVPTGKTFFWEGRYHSNMNSRDTITTDLNVLGEFDPVLPPSYINSRYLMLGNLTPDIQRKVILQMPERPVLICMDTMNFWMDTAMDDLLDVISMVDVLAINDEEARQLSGEYSLVKAANKIMRMGPRFLIVKKGEHGAMLFSEKDVFFSPAMLLENVVDPTGAGDTFAGGFMGYVSRADDISFETLKRALVYGTVIASFTVENFGTQNLLTINRQDIEQRLSVFLKQIQFSV